MKSPEQFAKNLEALRAFKGQSLAEFAEEAGIPKSTMQSIQVSGNTTLETAIRISENLGLPLDSLVGDDKLAEKLDVVQHLLRSVSWLQALTPEEREEVAGHFQRIVEVVCK